MPVASFPTKIPPSLPRSKAPIRKTCNCKVSYTAVFSVTRILSLKNALFLPPFPAASIFHPRYRGSYLTFVTVRLILYTRWERERNSTYVGRRRISILACERAVKPWEEKRGGEDIILGVKQERRKRWVEREDKIGA